MPPATKTNSAMASGAITIAAGMMYCHFQKRLMFIYGSSGPGHVVVGMAQPLAEPEHRVAFPRQQGVDADAGGGSDLLEAASVQFVSDEHVALLRRQLADRLFQRLEQQ